MEEREIDLLQIFNVIKRYILLLLVLAIIGGAVAFFLTNQLVEPTYEASTSMIVMSDNRQQVANNNIDLNVIRTNQALVDTYSELLKTRGLATIVIDALDLDLRPDELLDKIAVATSTNQTEIFRINVVDTNPDRAMDIANTTSEAFKATIKDVMGIENIHVIDPAYEATQVGPNLLRNIVLGAFIPSFLTLLILLFRELMDTSVKSADQLYEKFGIPVLAELPK